VVALRSPTAIVAAVFRWVQRDFRAPRKGVTFMGFKALSLSAHILHTLEAEGYATPTPIQKEAIPHILAGKDVLGVAQTGIGKTAAFAVPIIQRLLDPTHKIVNASQHHSEAHNVAP